MPGTKNCEIYMQLGNRAIVWKSSSMSVIIEWDRRILKMTTNGIAKPGL